MFEICVCPNFSESAKEYLPQRRKDAKFKKGKVLRVIERVEFGKEGCSYGLHPPLKKGGLGGFVRC
jgi:hypothetical protein